MALYSVDKQFAKGGSRLPEAGGILKELQGFKVSAVTGATANTKIDVAAMRPEDTLLSVLIFTAGVPAEDVANASIKSVTASGTATLSVGNPADGGTVTVNGNVYTFKTVPVAMPHVLIGANYSATGDNLATVINAYEARYGGPGAQVVASSNGSGVVTISALVEGAGNGIVASEVGTTITLGGSVVATTAAFVSAVEDDSLTVNGVTFTLKDSPVGDDQIDVEASDNAQATEVARVINLYQAKYGNLGLSASASTNEVTFVPTAPFLGNAIDLTENATNTVVSGSGFLAGGTNTGGFSSTTDSSTKAVVAFWYDKR